MANNKAGDLNNVKLVNDHEETDQQDIIGTIQTITITNMVGVQTKADMLITGIDTNGNYQWKRPDPYIDCETCGYGLYGCNCPRGFIQ
jgi:hypothetical protein